MAIRKIKYNVTSSGVTPASHQWGGVQNEDNATEIEYYLPSEYLDLLEDVENLRFRIDFNSPSAGYDPSPNLSLENNSISRNIPRKMTQYGGQMQSTLVISRIDSEKLPEVEVEIRQIPSTIFFTASNRQDGRFEKNLSAYEEYVGTLVTDAATSAQDAQNAAENARIQAGYASDSAKDASDSAKDASDSAKDASDSAKDASDSAKDASDSAKDADGSAASSYSFSLNSESAKTAAESAQAAAEAAQAAAEKAYQSAVNEVGIAAWYADESQKYSKEAKQSAEALTSVNNIFSNALKGTASGEAIGIHDVSPVEHEMSVKVSGVDDLTSVKVRKFGKNLLNLETILPTTNASVITIVNNSVVLAPATSLYGIKFLNDNLNLKVGRTYTASIGNITDHAADWGWRLKYKDNTYGKTSKAEIYTFTPEKEVQEVLFYVGLMYTGNKEITISNMQIEVGSYTTEYEPFKEKEEYTPDADGVVSGVTSLYPSTTLMTDTDGAVIEATYNKDINKAFEELKNAILATGGNV